MWSDEVWRPITHAGLLHRRIGGDGEEVDGDDDEDDDAEADADVFASE